MESIIDWVMDSFWRVIGVFIVLFVLIAATVFWFSRDRLSEGVVIEKYITEAYNTQGLMMVGKIMIPQTYYHPRSFNLVISGTYKGKSYQEVWSVKQESYNSVKVGQYIKS